MIVATPMPDEKTLRALIRRVRYHDDLNTDDRHWIASVLEALSDDPTYRLRLRMQQYEKEPS